MDLEVIRGVSQQSSTLSPRFRMTNTNEVDEGKRDYCVGIFAHFSEIWICQ